MTFLPSVIDADYRGGYRIRVTFNDNSERTIDFCQWLDGPIFEPLKDPEYFRRFFIDGGAVMWPNGADIAPETLYSVMGRRARPNKRLQPTKARRKDARKPGLSRARLRG